VGSFASVPPRPLHPGSLSASTHCSIESSRITLLEISLRDLAVPLRHSPAAQSSRWHVLIRRGPAKPAAMPPVRTPTPISKPEATGPAARVIPHPAACRPLLPPELMSGRMQRLGSSSEKSERARTQSVRATTTATTLCCSLALWQPVTLLRKETDRAVQHVAVPPQFRVLAPEAPPATVTTCSNKVSAVTLHRGVGRGGAFKSCVSDTCFSSFR
jgi:hypothetical protein